MYVSRCLFACSEHTTTFKRVPNPWKTICLYISIIVPIKERFPRIWAKMLEWWWQCAVCFPYGRCNWKYNVEVYAWMMFFSDIRISHAFLFSVFQLDSFLFASRFEFRIKKKKQNQQWASYICSLSFFWHSQPFFIVLQQWKTYTKNKFIKWVQFHRHSIGVFFFFVSFMGVDKKKLCNINFIVILCMCTSFRFNYFVEEPKMETNKRLNAKQKKIYQHRTIAPLAANQQQEKYENIKKRRNEKKR